MGGMNTLSNILTCKNPSSDPVPSPPHPIRTRMKKKGVKNFIDIEVMSHFIK
jgi:hypothetical protein